MLVVKNTVIFLFVSPFLSLNLKLNFWGFFFSSHKCFFILPTPFWLRFISWISPERIALQNRLNWNFNAHSYTKFLNISLIQCNFQQQMTYCDMQMQFKFSRLICSLCACWMRFLLRGEVKLNSSKSIKFKFYS